MSANYSEIPTQTLPKSIRNPSKRSYGDHLEPRYEKDAILNVQKAAKRQPRGGQDAEEFGCVQESPPSVQISYRNLCRISCRKGLETPLAAGLAAGAGGLGSSEALAVHP